MHRTNAATPGNATKPARASRSNQVEIQPESGWKPGTTASKNPNAAPQADSNKKAHMQTNNQIIAVLQAVSRGDSGIERGGAIACATRPPPTIDRSMSRKISSGDSSAVVAQEIFKRRPAAVAATKACSRTDGGRGTKMMAVMGCSDPIV